MIAADLDAIGNIAAATDLFPAEMLPEMVAGHQGGTAADIWLTAEHDGQVAGFAFCEAERLTNGTWNLLAIAVAPARQARGLGSALLAHLEEALRRDRQRILIVETTSTPDQAPARRFYAANGYVEEARIREFWDEGADKVTFWKRL